MNGTDLSLVGFGAAFGPLIIFSLYWSRMNRAGAVAGMVVGAVTVIAWNQLSGGLFDVHELLPGFIFASIAIVLASLASAEPSPEVSQQFAQTRN